jgi:phosphoglycerate dehydrogenase-like enzyme
MNRLLILAEDADNYLEMIRAADLSGLEVVAASEQWQAKELVADCNIILGEPSRVSEVLTAAPRLQWVQSSWAGVDRLCKTPVRIDYVLTGVKGIFGNMISEYVTSYLFGLERGIFEMRQDQTVKNWQPRPYRLAKDITIGIVGLGSIGAHLAKIAHGFDLNVIGLNRSGTECDYVDHVYTQKNLADFLAETDYLVLTLPDTPKTQHFINADTLAMMKSSAVLINVGRGSLINEDDLISALQLGQIKAAVLDVFETEPLPTDSDLWAMSNVFVTPHFAAASFPQDVVEIFVENYARFIRNETLLHVIDFESGY